MPEVASPEGRHPRHLRVLFFVEGEPRRGLSGPARLRVYQFVPWLERLGISCTIRPSRPPKYVLARDRYARVLRARPALKAVALASTTAVMAVTRLPAIAMAGAYDVVVLQRDLLPLRTVPPALETWLARRNPRLVFDFDDAIYTWPGRADTAEAMPWWRDANKIGHIASRSRHVIAGNAALATWAGRWNPSVSVVPTTVDLDRCPPRPAPTSTGPVTLGWSGTSGNLGYLQAIAPALVEAHRRTPLRLLVVCNRHSERLDFGPVPVEHVEWTEQAELDALGRMEVGLMPLADDEWARGKCGFKAIQYLARAVPSVVSPVGVNAAIVPQGVHGLQATTMPEWTEAIVSLASDAARRDAMGHAGRAFVARELSTEIWAPRLAARLRAVAEDRDAAEVEP